MRLVHHHTHVDLEKVISRRRGGVETPTSPFIVLRHAGKRLTLVTINSKIFGRHGAPVSPRVTPERPITTMVLGICLSTADNCQTSCRAQPPESQLSRSGPNMVATWSCLCQFYLSFDMSTGHRALRTFHPFPKTARVNFLSHQPTATPSTVVSDIHYRHARVTFEVRTSLL